MARKNGAESSTHSTLGPRPQAPKRLEPDKIIIRGAQQHNLRNVDVEIPRYKLVVLTGVSGSGKSSLAFDTIYAEGQRRYVESLSPYVRRFLEKVEKPKVDFIAGLSPAISIEQKTVSKNPRSTVGTITEVNDYLRLLYSRVGTGHCLQCGHDIPPLDLGGIEHTRTCPGCAAPFPFLMSSHFSPNSPIGMCPACNGLGTELRVDPDLLITDPELSLLDGASKWWGDIRKRKSTWSRDLYLSMAAHYGVDPELPWRDLPESFQHVILWGSGDEKIRFTHVREEEDGWSEATRTARGMVANVYRGFKETQSDSARRWYQSFMSKQPCPQCNGARIGAEASRVTLGGVTIREIGGMPIDAMLDWANSLGDTLDEDAREIAGQALKEVRDRLLFMINVGLHYLNLDRPAPTLSGGEGQRIRLASQLSCGLVGVLYVLDEPSIGLHDRDQRTLLDTLLQLRDMGNTVLVVEHDRETMMSADWIIDMGPGAGVLGGKVVAQGTPDEIMSAPHSLTGRYLSGAKEVRSPNGDVRREPGERWLSVIGASHHNLRRVDAHIPVGLMTCVTGVSGSGKSSLVNGTLYPALMQALASTEVEPGPHVRLEGLHWIDKVINITQEPIGRTPRSNPATYVGVYDEIRKLYAATPQARELGYGADRFSFNVAGGRCEACKGHGQHVVEMHFLADVWVQCKECGGHRFNRETLAVEWRGRNISDVLQMDVQEALDWFGEHRKIERVLGTLHDVGLDYVKLGQSATTLSGGEAQRVKLAKELSRIATGKTLYILDEPTTGLHFADIQRLLDVLHRLVEAGNSVLVIEHNMDVIRSADWVIDLGPEGGDAGGRIIAQGTPEEVAENEASYTGMALRRVLADALEVA